MSKPYVVIPDDVLHGASDADLEVLLQDFDDIMAAEISPEEKVRALRGVIALLERSVRGVT